MLCTAKQPRSFDIPSHLLYHDDVRAEHFKPASEEHDVAPAKNQTQRHHFPFPVHLTCSEHTQQHHQGRVAYSA